MIMISLLTLLTLASQPAATLIDYQSPPPPLPLSESETTWLHQQLIQAGLRQ
ncbi:MAG: hypothetical protein L0332_20815 [Chloroflexi bacterium]|nr:hypothetical protein [Chloroflexota bacterium]MCI0729140.1 hypothetical protein [Chloroflexota bacterium]